MDGLEISKALSKMYLLLVSYLLYYMLIGSSFTIKGWGLFCGSLFIKL